MFENNENKVLKIKMSEIDSTVIPKIREVNTKLIEALEDDEHVENEDTENPDKKSEKKSLYEENYQTSYEVLETSLRNDGQLHPVIVRKLTAEEKANTATGNAEYGIIDGHHRFYIANKLGWESILAEIYEVKGDENQKQAYIDTQLAFRLNESSIKMTPIEKGKVILGIKKEFFEGSNKSEKEIIKKIGMEIFGLKVAMAYRCVAAYKKSKGEKTIEKPRKTKLNVKDFKDVFNTDVQELKKVIPQKSSLKAILSNAQDCENTLAKIDKVEKDLKWLKKQLNNAKATLVKSENSSTENDTEIDNGKIGLSSENAEQSN